MYRYQGTEDVNNYICFGTTDNCGQNDNYIDKYMYRIIGITPNGELKIVKDTFVKKDNIKIFQWNDKEDDCGTSGELCTWPNSLIYKQLNGLNNGNNIFIGNNYYEYLNNSLWSDKIISKFWKYGNIDTNIAWTFVGNTIFDFENTWNNETEIQGIVSAKIGLIYLSDYIYSHIERTDLYNTWLKFLNTNSDSDGYWILDKRDSSRGWSILHMDVGSRGIGESRYIYPTFYVTRDIGIYGEGTKANPFRIS